MFVIFVDCLLDGFWKPTWLHFEQVLGTKLGPSWHQIAPKIDSKNDHILDRFQTDFLVDFVLQLGTYMGSPNVWVLEHFGSWGLLGAKMGWDRF